MYALYASSFFLLRDQITIEYLGLEILVSGQIYVLCDMYLILVLKICRLKLVRMYINYVKEPLKDQNRCSFF